MLEKELLLHTNMIFLYGNIFTPLKQLSSGCLHQSVLNCISKMFIGIESEIIRKDGIHILSVGIP